MAFYNISDIKTKLFGAGLLRAALTNEEPRFDDLLFDTKSESASKGYYPKLPGELGGFAYSDDNTILNVDDDQNASKIEFNFSTGEYTETFADGRSSSWGQLVNFNAFVANDSDTDFRITGSELSETIVTSNGNDVLFGNDGEDKLFGNAGNDQLLGGNDHDRLYGGKGHDFLNGQAGDDLIEGGTGFNVLTGGQGRDTFVLSDGFGHDVIKDFESGQDRIWLDGLEFSHFEQGANGSTVVFLEGGDMAAVVQGVNPGDLNHMGDTII